MRCHSSSVDYHPFFFFFFNDTATTEIYTLSLHDALPIYATSSQRAGNSSRGWEAQGNATDRGRAPAGFESSNNRPANAPAQTARRRVRGDRKSTRLNSSHSQISYAVFCLKKKNKNSRIALPQTGGIASDFIHYINLQPNLCIDEAALDWIQGQLHHLAIFDYGYHQSHTCA